MEKRDETYKQVQDFYGNAAEIPKKNLCCPTSYPTDDTDHIPQGVLDRFYGCGSPITIAQIKKGENVLDLGSGAGIDCFIASKKVGKTGSVIGIDMTDNMLRVANESRVEVARKLGYDNVKFQKGFLEEIPVEDKSIDVITSNCVVNLSPNKRKIFSEIWRVLKNHGRLVISDIVSDTELPISIIENKQLWGECLAGAMEESQFLSYLEQNGFFGIEILDRTHWKKIDDINFYSTTVRAFKFAKSPSCIYKGHKAVYNGPYKVIIDEEGHVFQRNQQVEICTDTVEKLQKQPYSGSFTIIEPSGESIETSKCCSEDTETNCC